MLHGDSASHLQACSAAQLEGLAHLSIDGYKAGLVTAQLFFGARLIPLGYLVSVAPWNHIRSRPR